MEKVDGELGTLLIKLVLGLVGGALTLVGLAGLIQGSLSSLRVPNRVVATVVFIVGLALVTIFGEPDLVTKILAAMAE
ncbi:MAG TPA: ABC transporter permease [Thermaerobacter sp.]